MCFFGFGKKKQHPAPLQTERKQDNTSVNIPSNQQFYQSNGMWLLNPNYKPPVESTAPSPSVKIYTETVDAFLARNDNAVLVKLTGKPEDLADYSVGNRCHIEEDEDTEGKFNVTCGGFVIGRLPASATTYAKKHDTTPDCLVCIVADVDYDIEKDRDIISVYIAD